MEKTDVEKVRKSHDVHTAIDILLEETLKTTMFFQWLI